MRNDYPESQTTSRPCYSTLRTLFFQPGRVVSSDEFSAAFFPESSPRCVGRFHLSCGSGVTRTRPAWMEEAISQRRAVNSRRYRKLILAWLGRRRTSRKARVFRQYSCPFFQNEVNMGNEVTIQQSIPKANAQTTDQFVSAPALTYAGDVIVRRYWQG